MILLISATLRSTLSATLRSTLSSPPFLARSFKHKPAPTPPSSTIPPPSPPWRPMEKNETIAGKKRWKERLNPEPPSPIGYLRKKQDRMKEKRAKREKRKAEAKLKCEETLKLLAEKKRNKAEKALEEEKKKASADPKK